LILSSSDAGAAALFLELPAPVGSVALSHDGSVAAGFGGDQWWSIEGAQTTAHELPYIPGENNTAAFSPQFPRGVSGDGRVVVGGGSDHLTGATEAFRWSSTDATVPLGFLPGDDFVSFAFDASHDGSVIVGYSLSPNPSQAFRWTEGTGMQGLGDLPGSVFHSEAYAVSADGSVIVGNSRSTASSGFPGEAFRWTASEGMVPLGFINSSTGTSSARAVSGDGSVIAGRATTVPGGAAQAFRWTAGSGMVGLGLLSGSTSSSALGISSDGSRIVGESDDRAFLWDPQNGMRSLQAVLTGDYGLDLSGWRLDIAYAISDDGNAIAGRGLNPAGRRAGWIAFLDVPEPGAMALAALSIAALLLRRRCAA
jgi:probable HAF family extracellular repeat protein